MGVIGRFRNKKTGKADEPAPKFAPLVATPAGKSLFISLGGRQIIAHNPKTPFITLYRGTFDVKQKGKTAIFEDKQLKTIKLVNYSLQEVDNGYKVEFSAKGYSIQVNLLQKDKKVVVSTSSTSNFEKIKLSFKRAQGEQLAGLGESKTYNLLNTSINCYPLGDTDISFTNIVKDYLGKSKKTKSYLSAIDLLLSSKKYLLKTNEPLFQATFEEESYHIITPNAPQQIEIYSADDTQELFDTLANIYPNKQSIPERLQQGFVITERISKLEKTLKTLNTEKIPASVTLIKDIDWQIEQLKGLEGLATRYAHRLILRVLPYAIVGSKDYDYYFGQDLLIKCLDGSTYITRIEGKNQAFIDLTKPLAVKYYKEKLTTALKNKKIIGFCAECSYPLPLDADYKGEDVRRLRTIWLKLFQKAVWEVASAKEEKILLYRGVCAETSQYGVALTEQKQSNNSAIYGLDSVLPSIVSLSLSGAGIVVAEIGGSNSDIVSILKETTFKEWAKLGILSPIMLFSDTATKLILKNKQYIFALMKKRQELMPLINTQIEQTRQGIPATIPAWLIEETQELPRECVCFGKSLLVFTENEYFRIRYKKEDNWESLII